MRLAKSAMVRMVVAAVAAMALLITGVGFVQNAYADSINECDANTDSLGDYPWGNACVTSIRHQAYPYKNADGSEADWTQVKADGNGVYQVAEGDNLVIHAEFNVNAGGFKNGSVKITLPKINGTFATPGTYRDILDANGTKIATYMINDDGTMTITPTDAFKYQNVGDNATAGQVVTGGFDFNVSKLKNDENDQGVKIGEKTLKTSNRDTIALQKDGKVQKSGADAGTFKQTITITSDLGTSNPVKLTDAMKNMHLTEAEWNTLKVTKVTTGADGKQVEEDISSAVRATSNPTDANGSEGFVLTLPQMDNGSKYVIEYTANAKSDTDTKPKDSEESTLPAQNKATANACDNNADDKSGEGVCWASDDWEYKMRNPVAKQGGWESNDHPNEGDNRFDWTVTIQASDLNLDKDWVYEDHLQQLKDTNAGWDTNKGSVHYLSKDDRNTVEDAFNAFGQKGDLKNGYSIQYYTDPACTKLVDASKLGDSDKAYGFKVTVHNPLNVLKADGSASDKKVLTYKSTVTVDPGKKLPDNTFVNNKGRINEFPDQSGVAWMSTTKMEFEKSGRLQSDGTVRWKATFTTYGMDFGGFTFRDWTPGVGMTLLTKPKYKPTMRDGDGKDVIINRELDDHGNPKAGSTGTNLTELFEAGTGLTVASDGSKNSLELTYKFPSTATLPYPWSENSHDHSRRDYRNEPSKVVIEYSTTLPKDPGDLGQWMQGETEQVYKNWTNCARVDGISAAASCKAVRNPLQKQANLSVGAESNEGNKDFVSRKDDETAPKVVNGDSDTPKESEYTDKDGKRADGTRVAILDWTVRLGWSSLYSYDAAGNGDSKWALYDKLDQNGNADSELSKHAVGMQWLSPAQQTEVTNNIEAEFERMADSGKFHNADGSQIDKAAVAQDVSVTFYTQMDPQHPNDATKNVEAKDGEEAIGFRVTWSKSLQIDQRAADDNPSEAAHNSTEWQGMPGYWMKKAYLNFTYHSTASVDKDGYTPLLYPNLEKNNGKDIKFHNDVYFSAFHQRSTHNYDKRRNMVSKSADLDGQSSGKTNDIKYTLDVNPNHMRFDETGTNMLDLTDVMTYKPDCTKMTSDGTTLPACTLSMSLKADSITVTDLDTSQPLKADEYSYTPASQASTNGQVKNTLNFKVPDGRHLQIAYAYHASVTPRANTGKVKLSDVNNSAGIVGAGDAAAAAGMMAPAAQGGATGFSIIKVDADNHEQKLQGAKFQLCKWTGTNNDASSSNNWNCSTGDLTSNDQGMVQVFKSANDLQYNVAYRLEETKAPTGYQKSPTYFYFIMSNPNNTQADGQNGETKPRDFQGKYYDPGASEDYTNQKIKPISSLPFSGGRSGRDWLIIGGVAAVMAALAAALLHEYRKREGLA